MCLSRLSAFLSQLSEFKPAKCVFKPAKCEGMLEKKLMTLGAKRVENKFKKIYFSVISRILSENCLEKGALLKILRGNLFKMWYNSTAILWRTSIWPFATSKSRFFGLFALAFSRKSPR
jgi:hypothetical protein